MVWPNGNIPHGWEWLYPQRHFSSSEGIGRYSTFFFPPLKFGSTIFTKVEQTQLLRWFDGGCVMIFNFVFKAPQL